MSTAFILTVLASLGGVDGAQVQFICNSSERTTSAKIIEAIGVGVAYSNLVPYYRTTYWVVGSNATRYSFRDAIRDAADDHSRVDIFIAAHGSDDYLVGMDFIRGQDILNFTLDSMHLYKLGLVYQTQCFGWSLADEWISIGADVAVGGAQKTLQMQVALEIPLFTRYFERDRMSVQEARDCSWKLTSWTDWYSSGTSFKHILGYGGYRRP